MSASKVWLKGTRHNNGLQVEEEEEEEEGEGGHWHARLCFLELIFYGNDSKITTTTRRLTTRQRRQRDINKTTPRVQQQDKVLDEMTTNGIHFMFRQD